MTGGISNVAGAPPPFIPPSNLGDITAPKKTHAWNNIGSKAKGLFGGIKEKWSANNPNEKRYLIIAAAILGIVLLLFSVLGMMFGFGGAMQFLPTLMPIAFLATWPMMMYGRSKYQRANKSSPKELEQQRQLEVRIEEATKAARIYNLKMREKRAASLAAQN